MAIDVIIPGTTPWVFTNAALAPGETVETAVDLNGRYMAIAEMASRGYVVGAQIQQASADVQADKERLTMLQGIQAGSLDISTPEKGLASTNLLSELGVDLSPYPRTATATGQRVVGQSPFYSLVEGQTLQFVYPPIPAPGIPDQSQVQSADAAVINPVFVRPDGSLFYLAFIPGAAPSFVSVSVDKTTVRDVRLDGITPLQEATILGQLEPDTIDAEIEKTIQISQGKQTYLQSLVTDYSTFYTTTGNMIQDYLKLLTSLVSRIG